MPFLNRMSVFFVSEVSKYAYNALFKSILLKIYQILTFLRVKYDFLIKGKTAKKAEEQASFPYATWHG